MAVEVAGIQAFSVLAYMQTDMQKDRSAEIWKCRQIDMQINMQMERHADIYKDG